MAHPADWFARDGAGCPVTGRPALPAMEPEAGGIGFQAKRDQVLTPPIEPLPNGAPITAEWLAREMFGAAVTSSEYTAGRTLVPVKTAAAPAPQDLSKAHFEACPHCGNTSAVHFMEWPARARWSCEQCKAAGPLCFAQVDARVLSFGGVAIADPYGKTLADCAEKFGNVHSFTGAPVLPAKPAGWHLRSRTDHIEINLCGRADELEVEVFYDFEPAERGSRDSAPCAARVTIARVMAGAVDLLPVLPQSMRDHLAAMVLEDEGGSL